MNILHSIALSIIQAITEFFPISSSSHLKIYHQLMNLSPSGLEVEVALHAGTLIAVVVYFFKDLLHMLLACLYVAIPKYRKFAIQSDNLKMFICLVIATIPAVIIGFLIKKMHITFNNQWLLATNLMVFGIVLYFADRCNNTHRKVSYAQAILVGIGQTLAFIPGVSRSGICLTVSRLLGVERVAATRFTFLLSIPTVLGAVTLTSFDMMQQNTTHDWHQIALMTSLTAIIGLLVIDVLLKFIQKNSFKFFALYRIILGAFLLWWWRW
jgi:undecaprenyl-diphosphatase